MDSSLSPTLIHYFQCLAQLSALDLETPTTNHLMVCGFTSKVYAHTSCHSMNQTMTILTTFRLVTLIVLSIYFISFLSI